MRYVETLMTPEMARALLLRNPSTNRRLMKGLVAKYAGTIRRGKWMLTHQGVALTKNGTLLDGQHRLTAIVLTGVTAPMLVVHDCEEQTYAAVDQGKVRKMHEVTHLPQKVSEMMTFLIKLMDGNQTHPTADQVAELAPVFEDEMQELMDFVPKTRAKLSRVPVRTAVLLRSLFDDKDYAFLSYRAMIALKMEDVPGPVRCLTTQLMGSGGKETDLNIFVRSWMAFDPKRTDNTRLQIKDQSVSVTEVREKLRNYIADWRSPLFDLDKELKAAA